MDGNVVHNGCFGQQVDESLANHGVGVVLCNGKPPMIASAHGFPLAEVVFRFDDAPPEVCRSVLVPSGGAVKLVDGLPAQGGRRGGFATGAPLSGVIQVEQGKRGLCARVALFGGFFVPSARGSTVGDAGVLACGIPLAEAELCRCFACGGAVKQVLAAGFADGGMGDGGLRQRRQCGGLQPGGGEQGECKGGNEAGHGISLWRDGRRQCSNSRQKAAGRAYNPRLISPGVQVCAALWALWANPL